jgi:hypothetical protein
MQKKFGYCPIARLVSQPSNAVHPQHYERRFYMNQLKQLAEVLEAIEACPELPEHRSLVWLTDGVAANLHPLVREASVLAGKCFITSSGHCDFKAMHDMEKFNSEWIPEPGEQDSFGWLTGIIHTTKGAIVFG